MGNIALKRKIRQYREVQKEVGQNLKSVSLLVRKDERKNSLYKVLKDVTKTLPGGLALISPDGLKMKLLASALNVATGAVHTDKSDEETRMHAEKIVEVQKALDKLKKRTHEIAKSFNRSVLKKHNIRFDKYCKDELTIDSNRYVKYGKTVMQAVDVLNVTLEAIKLSNTLTPKEETPTAELQKPSVTSTVEGLVGCLGSDADSTKTTAYVGLGYSVLNIFSNIIHAARSDSEVADVVSKIADLLEAEM